MRGLGTESGQGFAFQLGHLGYRNVCQFRDLLHQIDPPDDEADLGVFVFFAGIVVHPHEAFQFQL